MVILTLRKITWRVPAFNADRPSRNPTCCTDSWTGLVSRRPPQTSPDHLPSTCWVHAQTRAGVCALQHLCLVCCQNAGWDCWDVIFSALTDVLCSYVVGVGWLDHISHGLPAPLLFMQPYRRVRFSCDAGPKESPINVSLGYTNTPWRWVNLRGNQGSDMWMECGYQ